MQRLRLKVHKPKNHRQTFSYSQHKLPIKILLYCTVSLPAPHLRALIVLLFGDELSSFQEVTG